MLQILFVFLSFSLFSTLSLSLSFSACLSLFLLSFSRARNFLFGRMKRKSRLTLVLPVRSLYFTISWICCTSENKVSYPREREIEMLCFFKGEGGSCVEKGYRKRTLQELRALAESTPESMNSWFKFRRALYGRIPVTLPGEICTPGDGKRSFVAKSAGRSMHGDMPKTLFWYFRFVCFFSSPYPTKAVERKWISKCRRRICSRGEHNSFG